MFYRSFIEGRHTYPVVRLGFKPSRGRQTFSGRFDSCCFPPVKAIRLSQSTL